MATCELPADEVFMSLTGFDEIAIGKAFKRDVSDLRNSPIMFLRSLIFTDQRRAGLNDTEAFKTAMGMPVQQVTDYFPDDEDPEAFGDDSETEAGKEQGPLP